MNTRIGRTLLIMSALTAFSVWSSFAAESFQQDCPHYPVLSKTVQAVDQDANKSRLSPNHQDSDYRSPRTPHGNVDCVSVACGASHDCMEYCAPGAAVAHMARHPFVVVIAKQSRFTSIGLTLHDATVAWFGDRALSTISTGTRVPPPLRSALAVSQRLRI